METKDLIVKIPKPDEDGLCNNACKLLPGCPYTKEVEFFEAEKFKVIALKPGPGCPWYKKDKI